MRNKLSILEDNILKELENVIQEIIKKEKVTNLKVSGKKDRVGASISSYIEEQFVKYINDKRINSFFFNAESAPKGNTKNPWDAKVDFQNENLKDNLTIWIDFKAVNEEMNDSNPDMGSADKLFKMLENNVYLLAYVQVPYEIDEDNKVILTNKNLKVFFLHQISSTYRRTPTNQLQVNISESPEKNRSFEDFLDLHEKKLNESYERELEKIKKKKEELPSKISNAKKKFDEIKKQIIS